MPYGTIKVDNVIYTKGGVDTTITVSGIVDSLSGAISVTGAISGASVSAPTGTFTTLSGNTTAGTTATFTSGVFTTFSGTTVNVVSGVFASGTVALPSVSVGTSGNGLYSPGANQLAISTSGTGRLTVDNLGNVNIDSGTFYVDAVNNRVGVGTTGPARALDVVGSIQLPSNNALYINGSSNYLYADTTATELMSATQIKLGTNSTLRATLDASGNLGLGVVPSTWNASSKVFQVSQAAIESRSNGVVLANNGYYNSSGSWIYQNTDTAGLYNIDGNAHAWFRSTNTPSAGAAITFTQAMTLDANGRLGIGTTDTNGLLLGFSSTSQQKNGINFVSASPFNTTDIWGAGIAGGWAGQIRFWTSDSATPSAPSMVLDQSGRLLVGTSSAPTGATSQYSLLTIKSTVPGGSAGAYMALARASNSASIGSGDALGLMIFSDQQAGEYAHISCQADGTAAVGDYPGRLVFSTTADGEASPTPRMRISSTGGVYIGKDDGTMSVKGVAFEPYATTRITTDSTGVDEVPLYLNRQSTDGALLKFFQANTEEGNISVSGTTVSYNGAHLSRWSQLPSGQERTEILRGTILSNIDEMCEWGEEDNEQLNRMKVSDVEGDKNVAGVFQSWDDDDDTYTNDFYCAMTGDFIIRIGAGVTVERGDLLMSAGDGTAKPQDDDIIRSKTIAKVTSTNVSYTYEDGSYCVPCVLMAC